MSTQKRPVRKVSGFIVGAVFLTLAVIGLITVISRSVDLTRRILDNTAEKQAMERAVLPVIMFDPLTFESVEEADPLMLLKSSLWSTLLNRGRSAFKMSDSGTLIVPATDVEVQCAKLFGSSVKLDHQSFGDWEASYYYDPEVNAYYVPVMLAVSVYTPRIIDVEILDDVYYVDVGYIPPEDVWDYEAGAENTESAPDKIMLMKLKKVKGEYQVLSLTVRPEDEAPSQTPSYEPSSGNGK